MKHAIALLSVLFAQAVAAQGLLPGEREAAVSAIPGVVAAGSKWELIWADFKTADGIVGTVADQNIRTNGLMLSIDGKTLYVTNNTVVVAFDVRADGSTTNRRDFGALNGDDGGDGMAIDSEGRLYVTGAQGVHVLSP